MQVGVPREIKDHEYRVSLVPAGVRALVQGGHQVLVQDGAGNGSGIDNAAYEAAGAVIVTDAAAVYRRADLILKVNGQPTRTRAEFRSAIEGVQAGAIVTLEVLRRSQDGWDTAIVRIRAR